jgi:hypothetical protein
MQARKSTLIIGAAASLTAFLVAAGCGASSSSTAASGSPAVMSSPTAASIASPSSQATEQTAGALTGEAASVSAGDIPDNQVFLTLHDKALGFSMKYPEGWAQKAKGNALTIQDKNNIVRVAITNGTAPTVTSVKSELSALKQKESSLKAGTPATMMVSGHPAIKIIYTTVSAPNPVTGKSVTLMVDRYCFWRSGKIAVMDLGTPQGVDNVDAYRLMSESFAWK